MHEEMMRLALAQARTCGGDVPVGAVIVKDGQVCASACNEREQGQDPFAHAEILAMRRAAEHLGNRRLKGCTLYVTLEPCPMCAGALIMAGIDQVVFGAFDKAYGCCGSVYLLPMDRHFTHNVPCIGGVLEQECQQLLDDFFLSLRRQSNAD